MNVRRMKKLAVSLWVAVLLVAGALSTWSTPPAQAHHVGANATWAAHQLTTNGFVDLNCYYGIPYKSSSSAGYIDVRCSSRFSGYIEHYAAATYRFRNGNTIHVVRQLGHTCTMRLTVSGTWATVRCTP
jgi:hypothetical protein